ncbi:hypothetical protein Aeqsu_1200 [Aequorivita sublithincola DSM 14238]|uniref:Uncharacterized protein n=1 Tax=Aequorivita sublithincola (strain DSM 14238 / LMG 21431 / ACAM 643 / 9-3) TaxID=746697 RepID=I3YUM8_AEQSU|nr:hypothetical protein Aeqsu_1200 [Aequorivita sublithincola DSM 14238]
MSEKIYTDLNGEYLQKNPTWHIEDSPWKASQIVKMLARNPINPQMLFQSGYLDLILE